MLVTFAVSLISVVDIILGWKSQQELNLWFFFNHKSYKHLKESKKDECMCGLPAKQLPVISVKPLMYAESIHKYLYD